MYGENKYKTFSHLSTSEIDVSARSKKTNVILVSILNYSKDTNKSHLYNGTLSFPGPSTLQMTMVDFFPWSFGGRVRMETGTITLTPQVRTRSIRLVLEVKHTK